MWQSFTASISAWAPQCKIVYDKFHIMKHANQAVNEVRRAEFFRKGGQARAIVKGKSWLLLTRWVNLESKKKQLLNELFRLNRRVMKAYLLKEAVHAGMRGLQRPKWRSADGSRRCWQGGLSSCSGRRMPTCGTADSWDCGTTKRRRM
jgi:transposase